MRRYDERHTLAARLERGELEREQVQAVGELLARFHADAPGVEEAEAPVLAVERRFERNLHELLASVEQRGEIGRVQALERFAHAFITGHAQMFQLRASRGHVREGHGDLRAEHVLIDGSVQIVDCVGFDRGCACWTSPTTLPSSCSTSPRMAASALARRSCRRTARPAGILGMTR